MNRPLWIVLFLASVLVVHGVAAASSAGAAAVPGLHVLRRVEEDTMMSSFELEQGEEEEAYPKRRVLQSGGHITYDAFAANKAACYGPCPARGQPYTPGCQAIFGCRG